MAGRIGQFLGRIFRTAKTPDPAQASRTESTAPAKKKPRAGLAGMQEDVFVRGEDSRPAGRLPGTRSHEPVEPVREWGEDGPAIEPRVTGHAEGQPKPEMRGEMRPGDEEPYGKRD